MKHILISFFVYIIAFTDAYAAPLKGADLFTNPTNSYVQLSPDGKLLSYIESTKKTKQLVLFDTVNDEVHSSINIGLNNRLQKYHWLNSDVLLIDIQKGGLSFLLSAVVTGRTPALKMHNFRGNVISILPNQPDKILFALHKKHYFQTLLLVSIDDFLRGDFGDAEYTKFGVDDVLAYSYDHVAQKLFLSTYDKKKMLATFYWQKLGDDDVHKFLELEEFEDFFKPVHFLDENRLAVLTNKKTDKIVLQEFWVDSQSLGEIIYSHEMYDLRDASYDQSNKLFSVSYYEHGIYQRSFFKKSNRGFNP